MTKRTSGQLNRHIQDALQTNLDKSDMRFINLLHQVIEVLNYWVNNGFLAHTQNITDVLYTNVDLSLMPKIKKVIIDFGLESIQSLIKSDPASANRNKLGEWLHRKGKYHADCGEISDAISAHRNALEELSEDVDPELVSRIRSDLNLIYEESPEWQKMINEATRGDDTVQTDPTKALEHYLNAVGFARKLKDWPNLVIYLEKAGDIHHTHQRLDEARKCFAEALLIAQDKLKDLDLTKKLRRKLGQLTPKSPRVTIETGEIGDADDSKFPMPEIVSPSKEHMQGHDLESQGDRLYREGDFRSARLCWLNAFAIFKRDEAIWPQCVADVSEKLASLPHS